MRNIRAMKSVRTRALVLCLLLLAALLSSFAYMESAAGHECSHTDCPVCEHVAMLSLLLRGILTLAGLAAVVRVSVNRPTRVFHTSVLPLFARTPVGCKVRLNN